MIPIYEDSLSDFTKNQIMRALKIDMSDPTIKQGFSDMKKVCTELSKSDDDRWIDIVAERLSEINPRSRDNSDITWKINDVLPYFYEEKYSKFESVIEDILNTVRYNGLDEREQGKYILKMANLFMQLCKNIDKYDTGNLILKDLDSYIVDDDDEILNFNFD